jgi:hypothetical protein
VAVGVAVGVAEDRCCQWQGQQLQLLRVSLTADGTGKTIVCVHDMCPCEPNPSIRTGCRHSNTGPCSCPQPCVLQGNMIVLFNTKSNPLCHSSALMHHEGVGRSR